jgi:ribosome-associated heat shock protein Hsp15
MIENNTIRIDKWLWAARIFKTRTLAGEACRGGKIKIDDQAVKPSRELKENEVISIKLDQLNKTVQVKSLIKNRVSAKQVADVYEDLTPTGEYERLQLMREFNYERRERGIGRPTKKERRLIEVLKKEIKP